MNSPHLNTIMIYAKNMKNTAEFYQKYFAFQGSSDVIEGLIELNQTNGSIQLLIHQAAKSIKMGQANIKLIFSVENIDIYKQESADRGLVFGATHQANGYQFSNTKDPDGNSVSISSRVYRQVASV
ncbi:VOC family protein [Acinetobacter sp. ANC 3832]|uniref:VOC family protein n=1 Tax=Acinetobacter sp. ANC 3832 TaxID=1977874 RepID=UPI000A34484B|nr:VOC family protein [Acinetobacter sp. ANC 3832]OTG94694.1 glyoxalase [Acinetobacter sp. ANC 3832]